MTLAFALAACGGSSGNPGGSGSGAHSSSTPASPTAAPTPSGAEPATGPGAEAAIKANWATFFNAKTPNARRLQLLQNGQALAAVIKQQSGSTLAQAATSKVTKVILTGTNQASVTYAILVGGKTALGGQTGVAVYQDGVWKVGLVSFCGLLKLENGGSASGLPAACKG